MQCSKQKRGQNLPGVPDDVLEIAVVARGLGIAPGSGKGYFLSSRYHNNSLYSKTLDVFSDHCVHCDQDTSLLASMTLPGH